MAKASAFLVDSKNQAVFVTVEADADEFLCIAAGGSFVP
jgi:hypothetical protein